MTSPSDDVVVGKLAHVVAEIAPGKTGEVRVNVRGGTEDDLAVPYANDRLEINEVVEAVYLLPPRMLCVRRPAAAPPPVRLPN